MTERHDLITQGREAFFAGRLDYALALFRRATAETPESAAAFNDLGAVLHALGDQREAERAFRRALHLLPQDEDALSNLVALTLSQSRLREAALLLGRLSQRRDATPFSDSSNDAMARPRWMNLVVDRLIPSGSTTALLGALDAELFLTASHGVSVIDSGAPETIVSLGQAKAPDLTRCTRWIVVEDAQRRPEAAPSGWRRVRGFTETPDAHYAPTTSGDGQRNAISLWVPASQDDVPEARTRRILLIEASDAPVALRRTLRDALGQRGIRVGCISASAARRLHEHARFATAADAVLFVGTEQRDASLTDTPGFAVTRGSAHDGDLSPSELRLVLKRLDHGAVRHHTEAVPPALSVIVPTRDRASAVATLLNRLEQQDLDPACFEVVIVDDGSHGPLDLSRRPTPFALTVLRQRNAGPAAARNRAIKKARGRWLVLYNDDALPAPDNLRRHLEAHLQDSTERAVLGTFDFTAEHRRAPFVDLLQRSDLLFQYTHLRPDVAADWRYFYTCNLSLPKAAFERLGGFDESFRHALSEDVELGYRWQHQLGLSLIYDPRVRAEHDHAFHLDGYLERQVQLGIEAHRMWRKHGDEDLLPGCAGHEDPRFWAALRRRVEVDARDDAEQVAEAKACIEEAKTAPSNAARDVCLTGLLARIRELSMRRFRRGLVCAQFDYDPKNVLPAKQALLGRKLSVVIPNRNGFPHVRPLLESLRRHTSGPYEVIVVDDGSTDGSDAWLAEQRDVLLLRNPTPTGAPSARNLGLRMATGDTVLFADNDVVFTPRWRERLTSHLEAWPDVGLVGPMSDYVSGTQYTEAAPRSEETLSAFAERFHEEHHGRAHDTLRLISFCVLVRREVVERIGGFDERFNPWGFEDDDYSLRAARAGFRLRVAEDVFIRHVGSQTARTAGLPYDRILLTNWERFKTKWGLLPTLSFGDPVPMESLVLAPPAPDRDLVDLDVSPLASST